ncbi:MAG TPA: M23 family metallopeptidase [Gemmatimonadales bacterium]|jgi:murein DD-endopeptidase MepM/ murein hydrolase activator NlpD|nr:M23 family metallopeptidase [Gemmatimonadales bacterium]
MKPGESVTILIHRDGAIDSKSIRIPLWGFRMVVAFAVLLGAGLILTLAFYGPIVRTASRVPGLQREISTLQAENAKIREFIAALDTAESRYAQVRRMMGADIVPDPLSHASLLQVAPAIRARAPGTGPRFEAGPSVPGHWPLDDPGYVTRGQIGTGTRDEAHPGIDIAVPMGSLVRAAGGGSVLQTGVDPEYGSFVLLQHPQGFQTMYGHLSRIAVTAHSSVAAGEVIGLSGNSGRSSAPHLHFEIRRDGHSLDPLTMVKEGV